MIVSRQMGLSTTLLVATLGTLLAAFPGAIPETWNFAIVDQILHWLPAPDNSGQIACVEIDDATIRAIGRWPWPRKRTAELIDKIHAAGAKSVVVDLFFPETENPSSDRELAASLNRANAWIGYQFQFTEPKGKPCATNSIPVVMRQSGMAQNPDLFEAAAMLCNIPVLDSRSGGFLNASGRSFPMVIKQNGIVYPSLALASVAALHNQTNLLLHFDISYFATIKLGSHQIPLDSKGRLSIRPSQGDTSIPRLPAMRLLHPTTDTPNLKGKLVVLGVHATGIQEQDSALLQATAIDNLLNGTAFAGPGTSPLAEWFLMIGALASAAWPLTRLRGWKRWTPWTLLLLSIFALSLILFASQNVFVSPVLAIAGLGVQALPVCIVQRWQDKRNAEKIESQLRSAKQFTFSALAMLTTIRHAETGAHQQRIQLYLRSLALCLAARPTFKNILTPQAVDLMVQLAPIHDIGKVGIPDHILLKAGPLSTGEFELIQNHVNLGQEILDRARQQSNLEDEALFEMASSLIYSHHERWDGTGYPQGLKGTNIPLAARMMAVADVYDALVSKRVYKDSLTHQEAVRMITEEAGRIFDPDVVSGFLEVANEWETVRTLLQEDKALGHHGLA